MTAPKEHGQSSSSTHSTTRTTMSTDETISAAAAVTKVITKTPAAKKLPPQQRQSKSNRSSFLPFGKKKSATASSSTSSSTTKVRKSSLSSSIKALPKALSIRSSGRYPKQKLVRQSIAKLDEEISVLTQEAGAPFLTQTPPDPSICLFDRHEIVTGDLLGEGQFAQVKTITGIALMSDTDNNKDVTTGVGQPLTRDEQTKRQAFAAAVMESTSNNNNTLHQSKDKDMSEHCPEDLSERSSTINNNTVNKPKQFCLKHLKRDLLMTPTKRRLIQKIRDIRLSTALNNHSASEKEEVDHRLPMDQQFQLAAADLVVEALYLSRLQHPHIIKTRGLCRGSTSAFANGRYDSYFLILDQLGEPLDQRIRAWRRSQTQPQESQLPIKTYYAYQMALALKYLHDRRIIFRDLKPSNIGFQQENDQLLQIFDFGLCRELPPSATNDSENTDEIYFMTAAGTHRYMAVEILMGEKYNAKADVYSLAMVYYELLAEEAPFLNFSEADHQRLVCERRHRPTHFFGCVVPQAVQKLLADAWAHEISARLTIHQVVKRLEDILKNTFQKELEEGPGGVTLLVSEKPKD